MASSMDLHGLSALMDRGVYQPDHYNSGNYSSYQDTQEPQENDEEPVHALDLRICKVDESISRYHSANVLSTSGSRAARQDADWLPPPPRSPSPASNEQSPSYNASPPPTMVSINHRSPYSGEEPEDFNSDALMGRWPRPSPSGLPPDSDPFLPTSQSLSCKIVEAATSSLRFSPYERLSRPVMVKEEPMSPLSHGGLVVKSNRSGIFGGASTGSRSSFLQHVLQHKAMASSKHQQQQQHLQQQQQMQLPQKTMTFKQEPDQVNYELERRVEAINRSYSHLIKERVPFQDYSPPPSPPKMGHSNLLGPHHDLALQQRQFLMKLQQHHHEKAAAAAAAAAAAMCRGGHTLMDPSSRSPLMTRYPSSSPPPLEPLSPDMDYHGSHLSPGGGGGADSGKGRRGRPRKHAIKIPLPPLYVFIRNLLHNRAYNPRVISWVSEAQGIFKVNSTSDFAKTWGSMKSNRNEEMTYEKMSRAMRYHYGNEKQGRKGHLAMVKEKRLVYRFGELAVNWRSEEMMPVRGCQTHDLCRGSMCLWRKE